MQMFNTVLNVHVVKQTVEYCHAALLLLHVEKEIEDEVLPGIGQDVQVWDATGARQNSCSLLRNNNLLNDLARNPFAKGHGPI